MICIFKRENDFQVRRMRYRHSIRMLRYHLNKQIKWVSVIFIYLQRSAVRIPINPLNIPNLKWAQENIQSASSEEQRKRSADQYIRAHYARYLTVLSAMCQQSELRNKGNELCRSILSGVCVLLCVPFSQVCCTKRKHYRFGGH